MKHFRQITALLLTLALLIGMVPLSALSLFADDGNASPALTLGEPTLVEVTSSGQRQQFTFTPEESGLYTFYSSKIDECDPYGTLYDSDMNLIENDDDTAGDLNFLIRQNLKAGSTYVLEIRLWGDGTGSMNVFVEKFSATDLTVGEPVSVEIAAETDQTDFFSFIPEETGYYSFYAASESTQLDTSCYVCDASLMTLTTDWSSGIGMHFNVRYLFEAGKTYIFQVVTSSYETETSSFEVCIEPVPYTPINADETVAVDITEVGQSAVFSFTPEKSGYYSYYSTWTGDSIDGAICNDMMTPIATAAGNGFTITRYLEKDTTYFLTTGYQWTILGSYEIGIDSTPYPEFVMGQVNTVEITEAYQDDYFVFIPETSGVYTFSSSTVLQGAYFSIRDEAGDRVVDDSVTNTAGDTLSAQCTLIKDRAYLIEAGFNSDYLGSFDLQATVEPYPTLSESESTLLVIGEESDYAYASFTPETDGYYSIYSVSSSDTWAMLRDNHMNSLGYDDDGGEDTNFRIHAFLKGGETYILETKFHSGGAGAFSVCVDSVPYIKTLEVTSLPNFNTYVSGYQPDNVSYFGLEVLATYSDGTTAFSKYNSYSEILYIEGEPAELDVSKLLEEGRVYIRYGVAETYFEVTLIDNPIESIEYASGEVVINENTGGSWETRYNEETGETEQYYHYYSYEVPQDLNITIHYTDGTSETEPMLAWHDGYYCDWSADQASKPWVFGADNTLTVTLLGATTEVPVRIIEDPFDYFEVSGSITLVENFNGYWEEKYDPSVGSWVNYFRYEDDWTYTLPVTIYYKDGTTQNASIHEWVDSELIDSDWYDTQVSGASWVVGGDNYFTVTYKNQSVNVPVTVIENPVESIEVIDGKITKIENTDGTMSSAYNDETGEYEPYFRYNFSMPADIIIQINYKDGSHEISGILDEPNGYGFGWAVDQYEDHWELGDNFITINYLGAETQLTVSVITNPIESIEFVSDPIELIENADGYWDSYYNGSTYVDFFRYSDFHRHGYDSVVKVNYTDGTSETFKLWDRMSTISDDQGTNPWGLGVNYFTAHSIELDSGITTDMQIPVTIVESPVERIELNMGEVTLIENYNGSDSSRYNPETGMNENFFEYDYYIPDREVTVYFKDGSVMSEYIDNWLNDYHISFDWFGIQEEQPWVIGGDNYFELSYMGVTSKSPVKIIENPVESIEVIDGEIILIEHINGSWQSRYNQELGSYEQYYRYDWNLPSDITVQINYKDGSTKTAYANSIVDSHWINTYWDSQSNQPWVLGSDNRLTLEYLGVETQMPVTVIENPVVSVEVIENPVEVIENLDGSWEEYYDYSTEQWIKRFYYNFFYKAEEAVVKVNLTDGSSKTIVLGEAAETYSSDQQNNPWELGVNYFTAVNVDIGIGAKVSFEVPVTVIETPVESIEVIEGSIELIENYRGYMSEWDNPETDQYEEFWYYYETNTQMVTFQINFKDGTSKTGRLDDFIDGYFFNYDWNSRQYEQPWTVGGDNYFEVSYMGFTALCPVTIVENPVQSIEIVSGKFELIENAEGYWSSRYDSELDDFVEYFHYEFYMSLENMDGMITVKINYKDGTSEIANVTQSVNGYSFSYDDDQYDNPWKLNGDNSATISYLGVSATVPVSIVETPVERLEIVNALPSLIENVDGYWSTRYNEATGKNEEYFRYEDDKITNELLIDIIYKDGTSRRIFYSEAYILSHEMSFTHDQEETPWVLGSDNFATLSYLGVSLEVPITIVENPFESIEVVDGSAALIENVDGWWDQRYNDETGKYEEYFHYSLYGVEDSISVQINYKDGTSETVTANTYVDGHYSFDWSTDQSDPWVLGGEYTAILEFMGVETEVPVTIVESPVESIEVLSGQLTFIENLDGWWEYRYNEETGENERFFYYFTGNSLEDLVVEINYTDGTSEIANVTQSVNGYSFSYDDDQYDNPWKLNGDNSATISYMGISVDTTVKIIETPVESIEVLSEPLVLFENVYGYWSYYYDEFGMYYGEVFIYSVPRQPIEVQINYTNGSSEIVTVGDYTELNGYLFEWRSTQFESPWSVGCEYEFTLKYMGKTASVPVTIVPNPVASIEIVKLPDVAHLEYGYTPDFIGMQIKITYTDGTEEIVTIDESHLEFEYDYYDDPWYGDYTTYRTILMINDQAGIIRGNFLSDGTYEFELEYMTQFCAGALTYDDEKNIADITFSNLDLTGEEIVLHITYTDGTTEEVQLSAHTVWGDNWDGYEGNWGGYEGHNIALTEKGILFYHYYTTFGEDGEPLYYDIEIFGNQYTIEADNESAGIPGDVDRSGKVNLRDAMLLQMYCNRMDVDIDLSVADVDASGDIKLRDAILIQQYVNHLDVTLQ